MADSSSAPAGATPPKADAPEQVAPASENKPSDGDTKEEKVDGGETIVEEVTVPATTTVESSGDQQMNELPAEVKADLGVDSPNGAKTETNGATEAPAADAQAPEADPAASGTPGNSKNNKKRRSSVPEHKNKKLNKRKSMPNLNLNVQPGQYWMARMKGHPPWPAIACDEEMLPNTLLNKRPVSAIHSDGTYRDDFKDGGKNARDRRYAVMFLGTNEFYWMVNTDLEPLDMDELKNTVANEERGKKSKALWDAYIIASENKDIDHFKTMLIEHEQARIDDIKVKQERDTKKSSKKEKGKRKSTADEDVEMEDADGDEDKGKKASKKRKKDVESEGEGKAPKNPKTKVKINGPKPPAESSTSKTKKSAKKQTEPEPEPEAAKSTAPPRFADEHKNGRFKLLYHLRSRLQRGFLSGEPKADEMERMNETFDEAEEFINDTPDLEGEVIKESRVHRVLKNIMKMGEIPRDSDFEFKSRASTLLKKLNRALGIEGDASAEPSKSAVPNGTTEAPTATTEEAKEETKAASADDKDKPAETEKSPADDVDMKDAPPSEEKKEEVETTA